MTHMMPCSTTALWEALVSPAWVYSSRLQKEELAGTETEQSGPEEGRKPQSQDVSRRWNDAVKYTINTTNKLWEIKHTNEMSSTETRRETFSPWESSGISGGLNAHRLHYIILMSCSWAVCGREGPSASYEPTNTWPVIDFISWIMKLSREVKDWTWRHMKQ